MENESPAACTENGSGINDVDDNLSPISDSELEDDLTQDTTDAQPVSVSNDTAAEEEKVVNDNEKEEPAKPVDSPPSNDFPEDVEMKDVEGEPANVDKAAEEQRQPEEEEDRENNNSTPAAAVEESSVEPVQATGEDEPMDVDETDKSKSKPSEDNPPVAEEASQDNDINDDTAISASDNPPLEESHFQAVTEGGEGDESANVSTSGNQPDKDMLTEEGTNTESQAGEDGGGQAENVLEIEIGSFRDINVATEDILTREVYDKLLADHQGNIREY